MAGVVVLNRRRPLGRNVGVATVMLAALPDVLHLVPILAWWLAGPGTFSAVQEYAVAAPGRDPALPQLVQLLSHHLHCVMHSAPIAALTTLVVWSVRRSLWLPLLGWWSHIVIDVFTHSSDYFEVPVLYPFTQRGFDGIAWNTPSFLLANYTALLVVGLWLAFGKGRRARD